jgi:hypothetical protein
VETKQPADVFPRRGFALVPGKGVEVDVLLGEFGAAKPPDCIIMYVD